MATDKWITYFKTHHKSGVVTKFTRLDGEKKSHIKYEQRPATDEEIAEEKAKREQKARDNAAIKAFEARPEYISAMDIRSTLEWMTPESHPLDRLTVDEWRDLADKLKG